MKSVLIVGGGQGGVEVACSLRTRGWPGEITLVTEEAYSPYQRPPLSKAYLAGKADATSLALRSDDYYERERIAVVRSDRVEKVAAPSLDGTKKGVAVTSSGRQLQYDYLILAVGASPRKLNIAGADAVGISYLRDIDDANTLKERLKNAQSVVVIGGGFIGLEAAAVARVWGKSVTLIEGTERLMGRAVAPVVSDFYLNAHRRRGVNVELGVGVTSFGVENGHVVSVELSDGRSVAADLVVVGIGVIPRMELARQLDLACDNGICVDAFARTSHPSILAIGDCAVTPHPSALNGRIRLESVQNAVDQGKVAAATVLGLAEPYSAVPWFWSDQDTLKLQIAGLSYGYDKTVVVGTPADEKFAVYYFRNERLIAVDAVNSPKDYLKVKKALSSGQPVSISELGLA